MKRTVRRLLLLSCFSINMLLALNCAAFTASVDNEADLNAAIVNFNAEQLGVHTITITQDIDLTAPLTDINSVSAGARLLLNGPQPAFFSGENVRLVTIDGQDAHQILRVNVGNVRIDRLNFVNGNNTVGEGRGGALLVESGGTVSIFSSRFAGNAAVGPGQFSTSGGAIFNRGNLNVGNTLFLRNSAPSSGGAIANSGVGDLTIVSATFVDNQIASETGRGSAVIIGINSTASISSSTFVGNNLGSNASDLSNDGGSLTLESNLFARGTAEALCFTQGQFTDNGSNLSDNNTGGGFCGLVNGVNGNIVVADAMIGELSLSGGYAESIPLLANSPAIDRGTSNLIENSDQRGIERIDGMPDTGSFEFLKLDQFEDNDSSATASEITSSRSINSLSLGTGLTPDEDYFIVNLPADVPARFTVNFSHADSDIDIALFDSNGPNVGSSDSTSDNEEITFTPTQAGEHILRVFGFNDDQAYYDIEFEFEGGDELCIPIRTQTGAVAVICL